MREAVCELELMARPRLHSQVAIGILCPVLIALIGYGDFHEGDENSMLLLYLIPIGLGVWYNGVIFGAVLIGLSLGADFLADRIAGLSSGGASNLVSTLLYDVVFLVLLSRWQALMNNMHGLVAAKTVDLQREIARRKQLEEEVAAVTEHER